jgi:uncharacterized protein (TIGR02284 family)
MAKDDLVSRLNSLIQMDIDAVHAYDQAIEKMSDMDRDIRKDFKDFRDDHRGHVEKLSAVVRAQGGEPPSSPDFAGYLKEGWVALKSMTGTKGALEAMMANENKTNARYGEAVGWDVPEQVSRILKDNLAHEERHHMHILEVLRYPRREL